MKLNKITEKAKEPNNNSKKKTEKSKQTKKPNKKPGNQNIR